MHIIAECSKAIKVILISGSIKIYYVLELLCSSIFPYPEPSITAHIAELLLPIAWAGQNHPMKFEQTTHYVQSTCLEALRSMVF